MFGELLLAGARFGVTAFGAVAVFVSLVAALLLILYAIIVATDKEDKSNRQ